MRLLASLGDVSKLGARGRATQYGELSPGMDAELVTNQNAWGWD